MLRGADLVPPAEALRLSEYEGWVAWVDDDLPLFEARPPRPDLAPLASGADEQHRRADRQTIDWDDLPHERVEELHLYFARDRYDTQPIVRLVRWPDAPMRWIQMKMRGLQAQAMVVPREERDQDAGVQRTEIQGYRMGYYNPAMLGVTGPPDMRYSPTLIIEVTREEVRQAPHNCHPCWPRPHGLGFAPKVLGLTADDVPSPPDAAGNRDELAHG